MHELLTITRRGLTTLAVVVAVATTAAVTAPAAPAVTNCDPSPSWGVNRPDLVAQVILLINQHRASMGLTELTLSPSLTASSQWKSLHMAANGYFAHDDPAPVSRTAYQRAKDCGYSGSSWGENIAFGYATAESVVKGWLDSAGHRANIENGSFSSTGVGVAANAGGQLYWAQSFGNDVAGKPPPADGPAPGAASPATSGQVASVAAKAEGTTARQVGALPTRVTQRSGNTRLDASVVFVQLATGRQVLSGDVRCRAEVNGTRLRVVTNTFKAASARCAWRIPAWARGKKVTGVVALQVGGSAARRLFVRRLG